MNRPKLTALASSTVATLALALATAGPADAGWHRHRRACRPRPQAARCAAPAAHAVPGVAPTPLAAQASPQAPGAAPGALAWLNRVRQARGLRPLAWDPALAADAVRNSAAGFGHHSRNFGRGQVVGWGALGAVEMAWLHSPLHAAILLDPYATSAGFGAVGAVSTIDVR